MRMKIFIGTSLLVCALAVSTLTAASSRTSALFNFTRPTLIAGTFVLGHVVIEHDHEQMARGEACTTVYAYDRKAVTGRGKSIVSFHCRPKARPAAVKAQVHSEVSHAGIARLMEYQLAGEVEGHGVPADR